MSARELASVRLVRQSDGSFYVEHRHDESWFAMEAAESKLSAAGREQTFRCECGEEIIAVEATKA